MTDQGRSARTTADVTVVIPAYNASLTIDAALASVAAQATPPAQVVVVDDCSTDGTVTAADRWASLLPLQVIVHATNLGPARARHEAITAARYSAIALLDADDVWLPDHLETMLAARSCDRSIVSADAVRWVECEALGSRPYTYRVPIPPPDEQLLAMVCNNFVFIGALFPRHLYFEVGGFRDGFTGSEDWDLWLRMIRAGAVVDATSHPTVLYRVRPGSLSAGGANQATVTAVAEAAAREATSDAERKAALASVRFHRSRLLAKRAQAKAAAGDSMGARQDAVRALVVARGRSPRSLALAMAPRTAIWLWEILTQRAAWRIR